MDETESCTNACGGGSGGLGCTLTCNGTSSGELELISDIDCSKYYICLAGGVSPPIVCPSDHPYFNGVKCGDDPSSCCTRICEPYCPGPKAVIPDPKDCKRFYYCSEEGTPDENFAFKCPDGKNFNLQLGECTSDAECVIICSNNSSSATTLPDKTTTSSSSTCTDSLTCPGKGYFPACPYCDPRYLACGSAGEQATLSMCPGELLFHPTLYICVQPENCS
uniref:Chitin-binding type-2 domain-containing protein n=1 Tax=Scylla olivacea TaxID=85551 RepID=A0A0P4WZ80_SCYOL